MAISKNGVEVIGVDTKKIDAAAVDGLTGVVDSLAYIVAIPEVHNHSVECWFGNDGDNTMSAANNMATWTLTAAGSGNVYGTAVTMGAPNDILATFPSAVYFDAHRIAIIESNTNDNTYMIQLLGGLGTIGDADILCEVPYRTENLSGEAKPILLQMPRIATASTLWGKVKSEAASKTLQIIIGIHTYEG